MIEDLAAGLVEIEAALAAGEWALAADLADFLDKQTGGSTGRLRMYQALRRERAA